MWFIPFSGLNYDNGFYGSTSRWLLLAWSIVKLNNKMYFNLGLYDIPIYILCIILSNNNIDYN